MFTKTLSSTARNSLAALGKSGLLKRFYLAGGSALALHLGHRRSIDFDFFTPLHFDSRNLAKNLGQLGEFEKMTIKADTLLGIFNSIKFSLFYFDYPLIKKPKSYLNVVIADPADISAMKLAAIVDRGTKKDFIDLYFLAKEKYSLEQIFRFYNQKYQKLSENLYAILKSLSYFEDAEVSEMPRMIKEISWREIKNFFRTEVIRLGNKYLR